MAPRLQHKKSRKGCQRCKERRVKCDEMHPICGSCRAHKVDCVYESHGQQATRKPPFAWNPLGENGSGSTGTPAMSTVPSKLSGGAMRRLSELRLLHHFITNVAPTLPTSYPDQQPNMWGTAVVDLALQPENAALLHAIFAISALHWTVINSLNHPTVEDPWTPPSIDSTPDESKLEAIGLDLAKAHRLYLDLAVQEHRQKMSGPWDQHHSPDTSYLTSVLMLIIAIRMNAVQEAHEYSSPSVQWRRMAKAMSMVDISELGLLARDAYGALNLDEAQRAPGYECSADMPQFQLMKAILEFEDDDSQNMSEEDQRGYAHAAEYIGQSNVVACGELESECQIARRIMAFPSEIPERFMGLLEDKQPRAFIFFTHIMACARYIDQDKFWWLEGVARRSKARICSVIEEKWLWALPNLEEEESRSRDSPKRRSRQYLCFVDSINVSM